MPSNKEIYSLVRAVGERKTPNRRVIFLEHPHKWNRAYDEHEFAKLLQELSRRIDVNDDLPGA